MSMNMSIGCEVKACKHHHPQEKYCTLEHIQIQQGADNKSSDITDCQQFERK